MKKFIYSTFITLYAIIAVFTTVCLLSYNDYKVTEFGDYSLVNIPSNDVNENFKQGDLALINKKEKIQTGDYIFFYNTYKKDMSVTVGKVINMEKINATETTYTIEGDYELSSQYVMGPANRCVKIAFVGTILSVLESKWGFLFLIVFPLLIAFVYEITVVVGEIRESKKENSKTKKSKKE